MNIRLAGAHTQEPEAPRIRWRPKEPASLLIAYLIKVFYNISNKYVFYIKPSTKKQGVKKMTLNDILTLSRAGFNATQISALASLETGARAVAAPVTAPAPAPAPVTAPAPALAPAPAPTPVSADAQYSEILNQLGIINQTMQTSALNMAEMPPERTVDDVIASIINPPNLSEVKNK